MKVWKCNECSQGPCVVGGKGFFDMPDDDCFWIDEPKAEWHETTRYEITERKPDYKAMAENRQYGKFDFQTDICYGWLFEYDPDDICGMFHGCDSKMGTTLDMLADSFTPCAAPVELDDITMEPKND